MRRRPCETLSDISPNIMEKIENKKRENGRIIFNTSKTFPIGNIARLDKGVPAGTKSRDVKQIKEIFSKRYAIGNGSCSRTLQVPSWDNSSTSSPWGCIRARTWKFLNSE
jgi:hypothetical protein